MMRRFPLVLLAFVLSGSGAVASEPADNMSHLPLPRFASLRSDEVNMRLGPGFRYPISWVYTKRGLPVEITAEYDIWRRVRDPEGVEGWVSKAELSGKRGAVVIGQTRDLVKSRSDHAKVLAHLEPGSVGQIISCAQDWCKVRFAKIKGYLPKASLWGAYPDETFD